MATNPSLAAQKITSNSRLPSGLANDPPPSPKLANTIASVSSRLKSRPPPSAPSRKHSSYNFKATDPTSLLGTGEPLFAPNAVSPTPPDIPPGTPLLHAAATLYTPPVPLNLDLTEIAQPVPVRPILREGTSYCGSLISPLPIIPENRVLDKDIDIVSHSSSSRLAGHRRNSGFFNTFAMDGVEDLPILGRRRSRSNSGNYDEAWPLPPPQVVERGLNTPGDPRRSSLIQQEQIEQALRDSGKNAAMSMAAGPSSHARKSSLADKQSAGRILRGSPGSSTATSVNNSAATSKDSSQTDLTRLSGLSRKTSNTSLSIIDEASNAETPDIKLPSFKASANRKKSAGLMSPHTVPNSSVDEAAPRPLAEALSRPLSAAELADCEDARGGEETDDDWHSIRSHMTRVTTLGASSILYNMSMGTPNMALPTPEEMRAEHLRKEALKSAYMKSQSGLAQTSSRESGPREGADSTPAGRREELFGRVRSAAYPFPRTKTDKKGKGKEVLGSPRPTPSPRPNAFLDMFKSSARKAKEQEDRDAEAMAQAEVDKLQDYESGFYNRKVDTGSSVDDDDSTPHNGPYRSPWVEDEDLMHPGTLVAGDDAGAGPSKRTLEPDSPKKGAGAYSNNAAADGNPFHDNFATSSSGSAIPSLNSSTVNYLRNSNGSIDRIVPMGQYEKEVVTVEGIPSIPVGQFPAMSPALARNATLDTRRGSCFNERFTGPIAEKMGPDGHPLTHGPLSREEPKLYDGSSSSDPDVDSPGRGAKFWQSEAYNGRPRAKRVMRPGLESRLSTVRDLHVRRASTVEMVRSGATHSRVVVQESRNSQDDSMDEEERMIREAKLRKLASRKRSLMGRRKSAASARKKTAPRSSNEGEGMGRRISTALQAGFGGNRMNTDGRGGIRSTADIPVESRNGMFAKILDKFRKGDENDAIARKRGRPTMGSLRSADDADGALMRKKTSWWRKRIEPDEETGRVPTLKKIQEAIKRGNSSAMPAPAA